MGIGISKASDYAILTIAYFSSQSEGKINSKSDIARNLLLPEEFLSKILQKLTKAGIISSVKGVKGGYRLIKTPYLLTFLEVIEAVDGKFTMVKCLSENEIECGRKRLCESIVGKMIKVEMGIVNVLQNANFNNITVPIFSEG